MSTRRTPIEEIQVVGRVLVSVLARGISADCQNALQQMADAGLPLQQGFVEELHRSKELAQCLTKMPLARLAELRSAVGNAASSSTANTEIMGLGSFVHAATKELLPDTLDLQPLQEAAAKAIADGIVDVKESVASIGRLLLAASHSSMALSSTVSAELQDAVKEMVEQGTPLAASMVGELKSHAHLVSHALPKDKLLELQALCSHAISSEWRELEQFASQIKESINHIADSPLLDVVQQGVIDVYNSPLTRLIVQEEFANLDKAFTESRESLDAAMVAIVNGASVGACTSFLAMLPPLLRFGILRDFCQTVSLLFTNLYGTILDNQDSPIVRNIQAVFRAIYDVVSANFSAIWSNKREQLIDLGCILLLVCICIGLLDDLLAVDKAPLLELFAVVLFVTFAIPLPLLLVRAIKENRPTGSLENPLVTYDLDGEEVPFDDKVYARLIANDPAQLRCPYRSLYAGFESKWSFYKVFQLLFKVALILPLVAVQQLGVRGAISCAIYLLIVTLTSYGTPFSDPLNNLIEVSGKIAALVTCIGGMILAFGVSSKLESIIGAIVNIVNLVNLVVMLGVMLENGQVYPFVQNIFEQLQKRVNVFLLHHLCARTEPRRANGHGCNDGGTRAALPARARALGAGPARERASRAQQEARGVSRARADPLALVRHRRRAAAGDRVDLPAAVAAAAHGARVEPRLQRARAAAVRRVALRDPHAFPEWYVEKERPLPSCFSIEKGEMQCLSMCFYVNKNVLDMLSAVAHIPLYLYPFLNTVSKNRPFEYLRLTSLGVIGALVKVATFIVQKILLDEMGLTYICHTPERFYAVGTVLSKMVGVLVEAPAPRLLKHIIRCYLRLSDNVRAKEALRQCLPDALRNHTFDEALKDDVTTSRWLAQLLYNIGTTTEGGVAGAAGLGAGGAVGSRLANA
ncbi:Cell differentiation protein rcd1, partial [Globisporangium splendens]